MSELGPDGTTVDFDQLSARLDRLRMVRPFSYGIDTEEACALRLRDLASAPPPVFLPPRYELQLTPVESGYRYTLSLTRRFSSSRSTGGVTSRTETTTKAEGTISTAGLTGELRTTLNMLGRAVATTLTCFVFWLVSVIVTGLAANPLGFMLWTLALSIIPLLMWGQLLRDRQLTLTLLERAATPTV